MAAARSLSDRAASDIRTRLVIINSFRGSLIRVTLFSYETHVNVHARYRATVTLGAATRLIARMKGTTVVSR